VASITFICSILYYLSYEPIWDHNYNYYSYTFKKE